MELAGRRAALQAAVRAADPLLSHRDRLDREVAESEDWLAALTRERGAIEAMPAPLADELARVTTAEARTADRLRRALAEKAALPEVTPAAPTNPPDGGGPETRLEAALIEERLDLMVSRQIKADRLEVSPITYKALGAFPQGDPDKSLAWHEGAHALHAYRYRHGITDETNPLGAAQPRSTAARAERVRAQQRLQEAQRKLGRTAERSAQRAAGRAPTTGR